MKRVIFVLFICCILLNSTLNAQVFTPIDDANNPINSVNLFGFYRGCAWVDIDQDGDLDLSMLNWTLKNEGQDSFSIVESFGGGPQQINHVLGGLSWFDYENDGDLDCLYGFNFNSGGWDGGTIIYKNDGTGVFTETQVDTAQSPRTWSASVGDYDNDGNIEVVGAVAFQFAGLNTPAFFYQGNADGTFNEIDTFEFTQNTAPYTVAYWIDYDTDGDNDLFIAAGPAGTAAPDYIYRNLLKETGNPGLERIDNLDFATDGQDGQCYNVTDFDLDGDLDLFVTNYSGAPNRFYENDNGNYNTINNNLTFTGPMLGNCWGDFDNDGDEDVLITGDNIPASGYFENQSGTFVKVSNPFETIFAGGNVSGLTIGDYDNDGDLDFFANGGTSGGSGPRALFKNELSNNNNWVTFNLEGTLPSNRAALGTKVWVKATIDGSDIWLQRQVSAQNTFMGHNALRLHFGLGANTSIDSVRILWPSCQEQFLIDLNVDSIYQITEPDIVDNINNTKPLKQGLIEIHPNPASNICSVQLKEIPSFLKGKIEIYNTSGQKVQAIQTTATQAELDVSAFSPGIYNIIWKINSGNNYLGRLFVK